MASRNLTAYSIPEVETAPREGTGHRWGHEERKETVEERDSWAPIQDRFCEDCRATHWTFSELHVHLDQLLEGLFLFGNELYLILRFLGRKEGGYILIIMNCIQLVMLDHGPTAPLIQILLGSDQWEMPALSGGLVGSKIRSFKTQPLTQVFQRHKPRKVNFS